MTYVVPPSEADKPENRFEFDIKGKSFAVPKIQYIPIDVMEGLENNGVVQLSDLMKALGDDAGSKAVRSLDPVRLGPLVKAWQSASVGVDLGESSASTD